MTDRRNSLARIHILRKELALSGEEYRAVLLRGFGVSSAKDLLDGDLSQAVAMLEGMARERKSDTPPKSRAESYLWVLWYQELCPLLEPHRRNVHYLAGIIERRLNKDILQGSKLKTDLLSPKELHNAIEALKKAVDSRKSRPAKPLNRINEHGNDIQAHPELADVPF